MKPILSKAQRRMKYIRIRIRVQVRDEIYHVKSWFKNKETSDVIEKWTYWREYLIRSRKMTFACVWYGVVYEFLLINWGYVSLTSRRLIGLGDSSVDHICTGCEGDVRHHAWIVANRRRLIKRSPGRWRPHRLESCPVPDTPGASPVKVFSGNFHSQTLSSY